MNKTTKGAPTKAMKTSIPYLLALVLGLYPSGTVLSQKSFVEYVWPQGAPDAKGTAPGDKPTLTFFLPAAAKSNGMAVVICPGGAYRALADHEGDVVARWLNTFGVTGIVLRWTGDRPGTDWGQTGDRLGTDPLHSYQRLWLRIESVFQKINRSDRSSSECANLSEVHTQRHDRQTANFGARLSFS